MLNAVGLEDRCGSWQGDGQQTDAVEAGDGCVVWVGEKVSGGLVDGLSIYCLGVSSSDEWEATKGGAA